MNRRQDISHDEIKRQLDFYERSYESFYYAGAGACSSSIYQRRIRGMIPPNITGIVLELGSRNFEMTSVIAPKLQGANLVLGLDLHSPNSIARKAAEVLGFPVSAIVADVENIPLDSASIDLVFHGCFLHHLERPLDALIEIRRVLRVGGTVVYYLPCHPGWLTRIWQRLFSDRHLSRIARAAHFPEFNPRFIDAVHHRGHYASLRELIRTVHLDDEMKTVSYPLKIRSWNLKAFDIIAIKKVSDENLNTK